MLIVKSNCTVQWFPLGQGWCRKLKLNGELSQSSQPQHTSNTNIFIFITWLNSSCLCKVIQANKNRMYDAALHYVSTTVSKVPSAPFSGHVRLPLRTNHENEISKSVYLSDLIIWLIGFVSTIKSIQFCLSLLKVKLFWNSS